jgi:predicted permease
VVAQVAIALVLLIGSGLMIRTFYTLRHVDPGFGEPEHIQTFQLTIPRASGQAAGPAAAAASERILRTQQAILERLSTIAGVESAGFSTFNDGLPLDGDGRQISFVPYIDGVAAADGLIRNWEMQRVSPGFFATMRTPMVAGRAFEWNDVYDRRPVMLVSENLARKEWGSASAALGKRIGPDPNPGSEIIGVVKDVHHNGLNVPAPETAVFPAVAADTASFVIRSGRVGTVDFLRELRGAVWSVNPNLSPAGVQTIGDLYQRATARTSMTLLLLAITGGIALVLSLVGIYGVVSYAVSQRRREIGVRLALGAGRGEVRRMFVTHALVLVAIGVVIGLGAAAVLTRLMEKQLFGVSPLDPSTHIVVALALAAAAGAASYISALRGAALDPVTVLRGE